MFTIPDFERDEFPFTIDTVGRLVPWKEGDKLCGHIPLLLELEAHDDEDWRITGVVIGEQRLTRGTIAQAIAIREIGAVLAEDITQHVRDVMPDVMENAADDEERFRAGM